MILYTVLLLGMQFRLGWKSCRFFPRLFVCLFWWNHDNLSVLETNNNKNRVVSFFNEKGKHPLNVNTIKHSELVSLLHNIFTSRVNFLKSFSEKYTCKSGKVY